MRFHSPAQATIYRCRPGGDVEALQAYCDSDVSSVGAMQGSVHR